MVIGFLIYKEINKETIIIESFQVPMDLEKQNITGQAIVNKLVDQIELIKANADTAYKKLDVKPVIYDTQLEFVVPVTGISLKSLLQNLKIFLGKKQTRISGEVVMDGKQLNLTIRVYGEPSKTFTGELNELDDIMKDAAQYVLQYTQPYLLAYYLYYFYEKKDKDAATDMIQYTLSHLPKDDDAMAYTLEGFIMYDEERYDEAVKRFKKAIELDPMTTDAYNSWAYILNEQKKSDSAIDLYKKSAEIDPNYFYTYHYWGIALA
ncbi:MAG: tetratricopeptide repeat protein, partial [bacterium]